MKTFLSLLLFCALHLSAFAQSGNVKPVPPDTAPEPTMAETVEWLEANFPTKAVYAGQFKTTDVTRKVTEAAFTKCTCAFTVSEQMVTTGSFTIRNVSLIRVSVPAASLHLAGVEITTAGRDTFVPAPITLTLPAADAKEVIQTEHYQEQDYFGKSRRLSMVKQFVLMFDEKENAERIAKALRHLIKLCHTGQKKEPF